MFFEPPNLMEYYNQLIENQAKGLLSDKQLIQTEINFWKVSPKRQEQINGDKYYCGYHDILNKKREAIGAGGELIQIDNLPNNRILDNQYKKIVDQKANFLVGLPPLITAENEKYDSLLKTYFDDDFFRLLKVVCTDCLNCGIAWIYPYYDEDGKFRFKRFAPYEILPFWGDEEHTKLAAVVRLYNIWAYQKNTKRLVEKVEVYESDGVKYYEFYNGELIEDVQKTPTAYYNIGDKFYNWGQIPLIPFKYNYLEIPLIRDLKALQDSINKTLSDLQDDMQEDARNTILVLKNYDGENLGEFRQNLATYGAIKVRGDGDVKTLSVDFNADNYKNNIELQKKELISVGKGYDAADLRYGNAPNEMNIKSIFNDINMDANAMELEFRASMKKLLWFINMDLANKGKGNFFDEEVEIIFNKDQIVNESEIINDLKNSVGIISNQTLVKNHPYIDDLQEELELIKNEKQEDSFDDNFFNTQAQN